MMIQTSHALLEMIEEEPRDRIVYSLTPYSLEDYRHIIKTHQKNNPLKKENKPEVREEIFIN